MIILCWFINLNCILIQQKLVFKYFISNIKGFSWEIEIHVKNRSWPFLFFWLWLLGFMSHILFKPWSIPALALFSSRKVSLAYLLLPFFSVWMPLCFIVIDATYSNLFRQSLLLSHMLLIPYVWINLDLCFLVPSPR